MEAGPEDGSDLSTLLDTEGDEPQIAYHYAGTANRAELGINAGAHMTNLPVHDFPNPWDYIDSLKYPNEFRHAYQVDITGLNTDNLATNHLGIDDVELLERVPANRVKYIGPLPPR